MMPTVGIGEIRALNPEQFPAGAEVCHLADCIPGFFETEELSYAPPRQCKACKSCQVCKLNSENLSPAHRKTVKWVEENLILDTDKQTITASYPFNGKEKHMKSNYMQAVAFQRSVEKQMNNLGKTEEYCAEMGKTIESGAAKLMSEEQLTGWQGPVHYVSHFAVFSPSKVSTKLRIVSNSKQKNVHSKLSLNDCMDEGPDAINNLVDVLLRWRSLEYALIFDLRKAYQSIHTGELENHLRRFVFRRSNHDPWEVYQFCRVNFGDQIAALILELSRKLLAEAGRSIDPLAASQLQRNGYVDDVAGGGSRKDVERMKGEKNAEGKWNGTIPRILSQGGFQAKEIVEGGNCTKEEADALGGKFLGVGYDPMIDIIVPSIVPQIRLSQGKRSKHKNKDVHQIDEELLQDIADKKLPLTKRRVLACHMSQYDPLGFLAPIMLKGKLLLQAVTLSERTLGWDDQLEEKDQNEWAQYIARLLALPKITFPRSLVVPYGSRPWLLVYCDASSVAIGSVAYIRWTKPAWDDDVGEARLVMAKSRIAPNKGASIPRLELQALVLGTCIALTIAWAIDWKIHRLTVITDSECNIAALHRPRMVYRPYFQHRLAEILESIEELRELVPVVDPVTHVPSDANAADILTRGTASAKEIGSESTWVKGPAYLRKNSDQWPKSPGVNKDVPSEEIKASVNVVSTANFMALVENLMKSSPSLDTVIWELYSPASVEEKMW